MAKGHIYIISGPSGAGKHVVLERVLACDDALALSVSSTTRAPRPGEVNGRDYHFFKVREFRRKVKAGEFAEWAEVHGNLYGTLRAELLRHVDTGKDVILQLDVQGMKNLKKVFPETVSIFLMPPSVEELERRLRRRGLNTEDDIRIRIRNAEAEIAQCEAFDYIIVNDVLEKAVADVESVIRSRRIGDGWRKTEKDGEALQH